MDSLDTRLDVLLHRPEPGIPEDGFTEGVMHALPARRLTGTRAGRWTLAGAAMAGGLFVALLGAPLEAAFTSFVAGGYGTSALAVLFVSLVAAPAAWAFYSD